MAPTAHWSETGPREHFVQFYERDEVLVDAVGGFIARGLDAGATAIVIATRDHLDEFERYWTRRGIDLARAGASGSYVTRDAKETLEDLLVEGWPDARRFASTIEPLIAPAANRQSPIV